MSDTARKSAPEAPPADLLLTEAEARKFLKIGKTKFWSLTNQKRDPGWAARAVVCATGFAGGASDTHCIAD